MPVTPSYPGIYIQELPSSVHTITGVPTNIAVFVGYTHPFKTLQFDIPVEVFSFTDYEQNFGGLYSSGDFHSDVAYAVYQFFLNGGSQAFVVGLGPKVVNLIGGVEETVPALPQQMQTIDNPPIIFTAREITSTANSDHKLTVKFDNINVDKKTADILITYGTQAETFRKVSLDPGGVDSNGNPKNATFITRYLGTTKGDKPANPVSNLVSVDQPVFDASGKTATNYPQTFVIGDQLVPIPAPVVPGALPAAPVPAVGGAPPATTPPANGAALTPFSATVSPAVGFLPTIAPDFNPVFEADSPLDKLPIFNLLILPGVTDSGVLAEALAFCERKQAFLIMDPPPQLVANGADPSAIGTYIEGPGVPKSPNGALYFPYLKSQDPLTGKTIELPPSGYVAGIYSRTDNNRGVWKAPAGLETVINNTVGVVDTGRMNDMRQGTLNPLGVNCLREFRGIGTVVFGARTLTTENPAFEQWRYVSVRRMALFLEQTLYRSLGWVVFEPNDDPLWVAIRTTIEAFMLSLFHQGAFQGDTPSKAFQVKCDHQTTTQTDIDNGIVNIIVAFAPLKPAEFVIIKIAQLAGQAQS